MGDVVKHNGEKAECRYGENGTAINEPASSPPLEQLIVQFTRRQLQWFELLLVSILKFHRRLACCFLLSPPIFSSHFFFNDFSIAFFFFSLQRVIIILALHPKKPIRSLVIFSHLSFFFRYSHSSHSAHNTNISYHHFFSPFNRAIDFSFSNFFMFPLFYCVLSNLFLFFFLVWAYQIIRYFFPIISPRRSLATLSDSSIMTHFTGVYEKSWQLRAPRRLSEARTTSACTHISYI